MRSKSGATPAIRSRSSRSFRRRKLSGNDPGAAGRWRSRLNSSRRVGLLVGGVALASMSVAAHHSFAWFDMEKNVEYRGVISEWKWQNPHVHFTVDIAKAPGVEPETIGRWDVE